MKERQRTDIPRELVLRAQAGDREAFTALYERSGRAVYRTIYSMVQNEDTVWDIHQNTYIQAYRSLAQLEKPEAFLPWLRRIAVREAVRELTKDRPLTFTELAGPEEEPQLADTRADGQPEIELDQKEAGRLVREILEKLPEKQKLIVGMYYYEGFSIREIAEALHVTEGTVKTQLHLGRKKVEAEVRRLEQQGVKLYGLTPMAFLVNLLGRQEPGRLAEKQAARAVLSKTASEAPVAVTAKAAGTGFLHTVLGKVTIGALAALAAVGGALGILALRRGATTVGDPLPTEPALVVSEPDPFSSEPEPDNSEQGITEPEPDNSESGAPAPTEPLAAALPSDPRLLLGEVSSEEVQYDAETQGCLPRILADTPGAREINEEIVRVWDEKLRDEFEYVSYSASVWGDVLAVILEASRYPQSEYGVYLYDCAAGERLTTQDLLDRRGVTRETYLEDLRRYDLESLEYWDGSEEEKAEVLNKLQSDEYLMALPAYPDSLGGLWVLNWVNPFLSIFELRLAPAPDFTAPEEPAENEAFSAVAGTEREGVLGVILNGTALDRIDPTVTWSEGENRLIICPRYVGSQVSVWKISWRMHGNGKACYLEGPDFSPVYSGLCGQGDSFAASLDRPEEARWYVSIRTPSGARAGLVLEAGADGPLACEYFEDSSTLALYSYFAESLADRPEQAAEYLSNMQSIYPAEKLLPFFRAAAEKNLEPWEAMRRYCHLFADTQEGDAAAWTVSEGHMEGDTYVLEAARIHENYTPENNDYYLTGDVDSLTLADRVRLQAEYYEADPNRRYALGHFGDSEGEEAFEPLYFALEGITVYNPTLLVRSVELTVNGTRIGTFELNEDDFCTLIDLHLQNLPGDAPVRVEARIVDYLAQEEEMPLELWSGEIGGNLSGAR